MRKLTMFIHGWAATHELWEKRGGPLLSLFREHGYETDHEIDMPDKYLKEKDFAYYAAFLAEKVEEQAFTQRIVPLCKCCGQPIEDKAYERKGADEITLVCHSMGGVAARLYLKDNSIGNPDAKKKIKCVITLATPHHGTDVGLEELLISGLFNFLIPGSADKLKEILQKLLADDVCYHQVQPGSDFMKRFNNPDEPECPANIDFHSIWAKGDHIVTPIQSAVLEGASNYFIDLSTVNHMNIRFNPYMFDIIRGLIDNKMPLVSPSGLQKYPAKSGCTTMGGNHLWMPAWAVEKGESLKEKVKELFKLKVEYLWKCENQWTDNEGVIRHCGAEEITLWRPGERDCEVGKIKPEWRWHKWRKTGARKWKCRKCGEVKEQYERPQIWAGKNCCVKPFPNQHAWGLDEQEWKCDNCGAVENKEWISAPTLLGCLVGNIEKRWHTWYKSKKIHKFRFKCANCKTEIWHND